jgi:hypothetical protein
MALRTWLWECLLDLGFNLAITRHSMVNATTLLEVRFILETEELSQIYLNLSIEKRKAIVLLAMKLNDNRHLGVGLPGVAAKCPTEDLIIDISFIKGSLTGMWRRKPYYCRRMMQNESPCSPPHGAD